MSKLLLLWECNSGVLELRIPEKEAVFTLSHNSHLDCYRGSLTLLEFVRYCNKFLEVYRKMI